MKSLACPSVCLLLLLAPAPGLAQDDKPVKEMITKEAREAIDAGLAYLAKQQMDDGSWGSTRQYPKNVGISSFAGLAFLSAGHRPGQGPYCDVVAKAIDYVL